MAAERQNQVLKDGAELDYFNDTFTDATDTARIARIYSDTALVGLYVPENAGDVTVSMSTLGSDGAEAPLSSFATVSGPTSEMVLQKVAISFQSIRIRVTTTGSAKVIVRVRAINAGDSSVTITGSANLEVEAATVDTAPAPLLGFSLTERRGIMIVNTSATQTVWIAETAAKANSSLGLPVYSNGGNVSLDIGPGQLVYASTASGTASVRIGQLGG